MYKYEAVTSSGKKTTGFINADSFDLAKQKLKKENLFITFVKEYRGGSSTTPLNSAQKVQFSRDISMLLSSGLPLYEALLTIEEKYSRTKEHRIYLDIAEQVKLGKNLSSALRRHTTSFDEVFCALVEAGEQTGQLCEVFQHIETLYGRQQKLKKQLLSSLMYPLFLFCFCSAVLIVLFFFLIPTMKEMFEGKNLHPITYTVLQISDFLSENVLFVALGTIGVVISALLFAQTTKGKAYIEKAFLNTPILKRILIQSSLLRFSNILSLLLKSGVPLIEGLELSIQVVSLQKMREAIDDGRETALKGGSFASTLKKYPLFPPLFLRMLSVAEESGNIEAMLSSIATIYDEELERSLTRFTTMLQPIILLFLGIIVGVVLIAVLLPMSDMSAVLQ